MTEQIFRVVFDDGMFLFDACSAKIPRCGVYAVYAMEVIGNLYDNLELLGGADDD